MAMWLSKYKIITLGVIVFVGVLMSVVLGFVSGNFGYRSLDNLQKDSEIYSDTAIAILDYGTFHGPDSLIVGGFRRAPGYPLFLAFVFGAFGRTPLAVWIAQSILFALSIVLLWRISARLFPSNWQFLPPALLSLAWFVSYTVSALITETLTVFLLLLALWLLMLVQDHMSWRRRVALLMLAGFILGYLTLIKPVVLYLIPLIVVFIFLRDRRIVQFRQRVAILAIFIFATIAVITPWLLYTHRTFGSFQIAGTGSQNLAWKAREATATWRTIGASFVGGAMGDLIADKLFPGYADDPEPFDHIVAVFNSMREMRGKGLPEAEIEQYFLREGIQNITSNPVKFVVTSVTGFLRLNTPVNHLGWQMTHFLTGTHEQIPNALKVIAILLIRLAWYLFLIAILVAMIHYRREWRTWGLFAVVIIYWNGMHALFTHNEARFALPIMPLYILFFVAYLFSQTEYGKSEREVEKTE